MGRQQLLVALQRPALGGRDTGHRLTRHLLGNYTNSTPSASFNSCIFSTENLSCANRPRGAFGATVANALTEPTSLSSPLNTPLETKWRMKLDQHVARMREMGILYNSWVGATWKTRIRKVKVKCPCAQRIKHDAMKVYGGELDVAI